VQRDERRVLEAYEAVLIEQPSNRIALNNLVSQYQQAGRWRDMEAMARRYLANDSTNLTAWTYLLTGQAALGDRSVERATREALRQKFATGPGARDAQVTLVRAAFTAREYEAVERDAADLLKQDNLVPPQKLELAQMLTFAALHRGHLSGATRASRELVAELVRIDPKAWERLAKVDTLLEGLVYRAGYQEDTAGAKAALPAALAAARIDRLTPAEQLRGGFMDLYAMLGAGNQARALFAAARRSGLFAGKDDAQDSLFASVGVASAEGRWSEALTMMRSWQPKPNAWPDPRVEYVRGLLEAKAGSKSVAIENFKTLVNSTDPRRAGNENSFYAWSLRRLCRMSNEAGNAADRRTYCGRIAELWRDADPMLQPQVAEFRALAAK
jgi:hypothetical protein